MRVREPQRAISWQPAKRNDPAVFLVMQRQFGLVHARSHQLLETTGFNSCVVVVFHSKTTGISAIAHFDINTRVKESFEQVIQPGLNGKKRGLSARLFGGLPESSQQLARDIRDALMGERIPIKSMALFDREEWDGLSVDCKTGEVTITTPIVPTLVEADQRHEEYINHMLANDGLLKSVAPPPGRPAPLF